MRVHVIGAGLAGMSAALELTQRGAAVTLYEAAPVAGGRCRSFLDERLGCEIDNGGHVLLGANTATLALLKLVGGTDALTEIAPARFPFLDLSTGKSWSIRPNRGPIPWWILMPPRRVPDTSVGDYVSALRLVRAGAIKTVADCLTTSPLTSRLWEPLTTAVMNAPLDQAAARPLGRMVRQSFGRGEAACRPYMARRGLSHAFAHPVLRFLATRTAVEYRSGYRLAAIETSSEAITALRFDDERIVVGDTDRIVLAVPAHIAVELLPSLTVPVGTNAIINAHFRLDRAVSLPSGLPLLGLLGATAQWLIARDKLISVTVSAADALVDRPVEELLSTLWGDVSRALSLTTPIPPARLIKERRATFAQTPANQGRRPGPITRWRNLFLAGDWTDTGLPATIEGAVRSGSRAAAHVLG